MVNGLQAFPSSCRLHNSREFDTVFKQNEHRISTPEFLFLARKNHLKQKRLGMVVSKRNTALAVNRNKLKRLIRESFRKHKLPPLDVVVLTRSAAMRQSVEKLTKTLDTSFSELAAKFTPTGL